ncbi:hypothetical protein SAMN02745866_00372 [Alteromonadaceae bacterium Bs31]|nr:hypothetical protein SAMN02745866_00372 [Alteromonadaceae bacterium Bs31]
MYVTITGLYFYPIKSCEGIPLQQATIGNKGIAGDREWIIVDEAGTFVSQRSLPRMSLLQAESGPDGITLRLRDQKLNLPACEVKHPRLSAQSIETHIWKDHAPALLAAEEVNQWLTKALHADKQLKLAYFDKRGSRLPGKPERFGANASFFADAAPFLICNALSLHALNLSLRLQELPEVDIRHFRPNIVFSGLPGFAEQHVVSLSHKQSGLSFKLVDPCQRCSVITIDPDTAQRLPDAVPFGQLTAINPMPSNPKAPAFGMNAVVSGVTTQKVLKLGDQLKVEIKYRS